MRLLVATDLSPNSVHALLRAAAFSRQREETELAVLHVVAEERWADVADRRRSEAMARLEEHVRSVAPGLSRPPELLVRDGDPIQAIIEVSREREPDLLLLGRHRRQLLADLVVGGTAERVLKASHVPVLLVNEPVSGPYERVTVAVDFSEASQRALEVIEDLGIVPASAVAVHAFHTPAYGKLVEAGLDSPAMKVHVDRAAASASTTLGAFLRRLGRDTWYEAVVEAGNPAHVIRKVITERRTQLLVLGTRGLSGLKRVLLGSVAEALLQDATCDLLIVPQRVPAPPLTPSRGAP